MQDAISQAVSLSCVTAVVTALVKPALRRLSSENCTLILMTMLLDGGSSSVLEEEGSLLSLLSAKERPI